MMKTEARFGGSSEIQISIMSISSLLLKLSFRHQGVRVWSPALQPVPFEGSCAIIIITIPYILLVLTHGRFPGGIAFPVGIDDLSFQDGGQPGTLRTPALEILPGLQSGQESFLYQVVCLFRIIHPDNGIVKEVITVAVHPKPGLQRMFYFFCHENQKEQYMKNLRVLQEIVILWLQNITKMKIVDTKGLTCPRPLIMLKEALLEVEVGAQLQVITDNETSLKNLLSYLHDQGAKPRGEDQRQSSYHHNP